MSAAVVHYIKHWDNDTKGYIEFGQVDKVEHAILLTKLELKNEWISDQDGDVDLSKFDDNLFTITKAEIVDSVQNYSGFRSTL